VEFVRPAACSTPNSIPDGIWRSVVSSRSAAQPDLLPDRVERSHRMPLRSQLAHAAKAVYDGILGDDLGNVFGKEKSLQQRALGTVSLASGFLPFGKVAGLGLGAVRAVPVAAVTTGAHAAEQAGGDALLHESMAAAKSVLRDVGGAHPSLDLQAIERGRSGEPHTLAKHVAKDEAFLKDRVLKEGKNDASTFTDEASAQRSADAVIADPRNQATIAKWIDDGMLRNLRLDGPVSGDPIGRVLTRADVIAGLSSRIATNATVILKADLHSPSNYTILTAYPSLQAR